MRKKDPNKYPAGWTGAHVRSIIAHHDRQTEDDAIAQANVAFENSRIELIRVPQELVPEVKRLIAERTRSASRTSENGSTKPARSVRSRKAA